MASRRKAFVPKGKAETDRHVAAEFINELLNGTVKATTVHIVDQGSSGRKRLEYDDPEG